MTLLDELFEQPDTKVVVFSQWLRMHELIIRRLQDRGWGHVLFHGGVPGDERPALVDRFRDDPDCRVFLSTDAGGVGLNLQHAAASSSTWTCRGTRPCSSSASAACIASGRRSSVQVVNFVAQGTIEEGMLSVLAFKKSLFAGVLDGGESEVFLHGTRLTKFMETVDEVTGAIGPAEAAETAIAESAIAEPALPVREERFQAADSRLPLPVSQEGPPAASPPPRGG